MFSVAFQYFPIVWLSRFISICFRENIIFGGNILGYFVGGDVAGDSTELVNGVGEILRNLFCRAGNDCCHMSISSVATDEFDCDVKLAVATAGFDERGEANKRLNPRV